MPKTLRRLGRILWRIVRPLSWVQRAHRWALLGCSILGISALAEKWGEPILLWINADWQHRSLVAAGTLLFFTLLAFYGLEKETDELELRGVAVSCVPKRTGLLPQYAIDDVEEKDVIFVELLFHVRNNSERAVNLRVKSVRLQRKTFGFWRIAPFRFGSSGDRPVFNSSTLALTGGTENDFSLSIFGATPGGADLILYRSLRLKVNLAIPGQRDPEIIVKLQQVTDYHRLT